MNPLHNLPSYIIHIHFNIIFLSTPRYSKWLFLSGFPTKGIKCSGRPKLCVIFRNILRWGVVCSLPSTDPGRAPPVSCPVLLIQYVLRHLCIWRPSPSPGALEGAVLWWRISTCRDVVLTACYSKGWTEFRSRNAPHDVWLRHEAKNKTKTRPMNPPLIKWIILKLNQTSRKISDVP